MSEALPMTPEQVQKIVEDALNGWAGPPWWAYAIIALLMIGAAFVGAYIKKRGENYATTADFDKLIKQLEGTTRAAESVKQALAGKGWVKQQHWANREKYYLEILRNLSIMGSAATDLFNQASVKEYGGAKGVQLDLTHTWKDYQEAKVKLVEMLGPAAVFIAKDVIDALYKLLEQEMDAAEDSTKATTFYNLVSNAVHQARERILDIAQKELREAEDSTAPPKT